MKWEAGLCEVKVDFNLTTDRLQYIENLPSVFFQHKVALFAVSTVSENIVLHT